MTGRRTLPPPGLSETFLADNPLKVNPLVAWVYRRLWDWRNPSTRFIFFATTGRSGTGLFARVLDECSGVHGFHERRPVMNGEVLVARQTGSERTVAREYWVRKSVNLRRGATGCAHYAEANHLFIKSFHDYVMKDLRHRVSVVHLRRDPVGVAASMSRVPEIPGTDAGAKWYLDWRLDGCLVPARDLLEDGAEFGTAYFRCLWYWYEIEARVRRFREQHPRVPVFCFPWSGTIDPDRVCDLLSSMGLEHDPRRVAQLCEVRINAKADEKKAHASTTGATAVIDGESGWELHRDFRSRLMERCPDLPEFRVEEGECCEPR